MATAQPITLVRRDGAGFPVTVPVPEDAAETFNRGVLIFLDADGMANEVPDGFTGSEIVYGVSIQPGQNLATQDTAEQGNEGGTPQNQSGVTTAMGSPTKSGKTNLYAADGQHVFRIALVDGQTYSAALLGPANTRYELSRESNGYWALDSTDSGTGDDHAAVLVGPDPENDEFVYFKFAEAVRAHQ